MNQQKHSDYLIKASLYLVVGLYLLKAPFFQEIVSGLCFFLAQAVYFVLSPFDSNVKIEETTLIWKTYGYAIVIDKSCSATTYVVAVAAAICAFPLQLKKQIATVFSFFFIIQLANIVRLIIIFYSQVVFSKSLFDVIHEQVMPLMLSFLTVLSFFYWVTKRTYGTEIDALDS